MGQRECKSENERVRVGREKREGGETERGERTANNFGTMLSDLSWSY